MKHLYALLILLSMPSFAQIDYQQGYFIDNNGIKTDCLIKNYDWSDTPEKFEYKLSEADAEVIIKDSEMKELYVDDIKYINVNVEVEQSPTRLDQLSTRRQPEFKREMILLKLIVDGNYKLYYYKKNEVQRYFFNVNDGEIKQLISKKYYTDNSQAEMATNNAFRQQLWNEAKCPETTIGEIQKLSYTNKDLVGYFQSINTCNASSVSSYTKDNTKKGIFNLKASVMLGMHGMEVESSWVNHDFGNKPFITAGFEAEYIFPFWKNTWSFIFEPTFFSYKNSAPELSVEYKYARLSAGFRHYFFVNNKPKFFLNFGVNLDVISGNSYIKFDESLSHTPYEFPSALGTFAVGAGYNFGKLNCELRYNTSADPLSYNGVKYTYNNFGVIVRYQFLKL